jgi:hypothetical protein
MTRTYVRIMLGRTELPVGVGSRRGLNEDPLIRAPPNLRCLTTPEMSTSHEHDVSFTARSR